MPDDFLKKYIHNILLHGCIVFVTVSLFFVRSDSALREGEPILIPSFEEKIKVHVTELWESDGPLRTNQEQLNTDQGQQRTQSKSANGASVDLGLEKRTLAKSCLISDDGHSVHAVPENGYSSEAAQRR